MIENQRGMSSPAGAIGTIPASGTSSRSPARSARQPPSELPARTTAPSSSATYRTAAAANASSCGEHRPVGQRVGGAEAREVDGERPAAAAGELVEHEPPGVGRVRPAVEEDDRRAVALELERARVEAGELEAVLEERLLHRGRHDAPGERTTNRAQLPDGLLGRLRADPVPRPGAHRARRGATVTGRGRDLAGQDARDVRDGAGRSWRRRAKRAHARTRAVRAARRPGSAAC